MGRTVSLVLACAVAAAAQQITLLEPNGGQVYHVGDTMRIRWTADSMISLVCVEMSVDGDESGMWYRVFGRQIGRGGSGWGDTTWVVRDTLRDATTAVSTVSTQCLMRIRNYVDQVTEDRSDSVFTVLPAGGAVRGRGRSLAPGAGSVACVEGVLSVCGSSVTAAVSDLCGRLTIARAGAAPVRLAPGAYLVRVRGPGVTPPSHTLLVR